MSSSGSKKSARLLSQKILGALSGLRAAGVPYSNTPRGPGQPAPAHWRNVEARAFSEAQERTGFWENYKALKPNGEFLQHLHIWVMSEENASDIGHVDTHYSVPWVPLWPSLVLGDVSAYYSITKFALMPSGWEGLWLNLDHMICLRRAEMFGSRRARVHGPYWRLLARPNIDTLAAELVDIKRGITREIFNTAGPLGKSESLKLHRDSLRTALEPFRVMTNQQEIDDEAARVSEERALNIPVGDGAPSDRPPRCW